MYATETSLLMVVDDSSRRKERKVKEDMNGSRSVVVDGLSERKVGKKGYE